mmetsp:Transcript_29392/g.83659  ORF Transcript_29392/g.83659 Transcript_29392/m.83659 type:complete len:228 (-) Transcript_29392:7-690(-)
MVLVRMDTYRAFARQRWRRKDRKRAGGAASSEPDAVAIRPPNHLVHLELRVVHRTQAQLGGDPEVQEEDLVGASAQGNVLRRGRPAEKEEILQRRGALLQVYVVDGGRRGPRVEDTELAAPAYRGCDKGVVGVALCGHPVPGPRPLLLAHSDIEEPQGVVLVARDQELVARPIQRSHPGPLLIPQEVMRHLVRQAGAGGAERLGVEAILLAELGVDKRAEDVSDVGR